LPHIIKMREWKMMNWVWRVWKAGKGREMHTGVW